MSLTFSFLVNIFFKRGVDAITPITKIIIVLTLNICKWKNILILPKPLNPNKDIKAVLSKLISVN